MGAFLYGAFDEGAFYVSEYTPVVVDEPARVGGDDAPGRHRGWNRKRATLKLNREREFTEQIRRIYRDLTAAPEVAQEAEQIVERAVSARAVPVRDRARLADALYRHASAGNPVAVQAELELRFLHRRFRDLMERDDEQALLQIIQIML